MVIDANSESLLELLTRSELSVTGRLVDASNATLLCELIGSDHSDLSDQSASGEQVLQAIYKPIAGERPLWDFPDGRLAWRERAAYLLSSLAGFNIVPPTVLRDGPFGEGAVQLWIDCDESVDIVEYGQTENSFLRALALFDAIINNTDRKFGHLLLTSEGQLFGCDHGVSFHQDPKLRTVLWQFSGEKFTDREVALLHHATESITHEEFSHLLTGAEIAATSERIATLLEEGEFPFPSGDWPAVPWPPY